MNSSQQRSICVIGDAYVDVLAAAVPRMPQWGNDTHAKSISLHSGGGAANTAVSLARLGIPTSFVGAAGDDSFAEFMVGALKKNGVSLPSGSLLKLKGENTGTCIVLSGKTDRGFVSCMGANAIFVTSMIPREVVYAAQHLHWAAFFNTPGLQSAEQVDFLREVKKRGMSISFDPQFDAAQKWRGENDSVLEVLKLIDIFLPSEEELMGITKTSNVDEAIKASASYLRSDALLVVKCGEKGAQAVKAGKVLANCPAFPTTVVDTTGAGDAFNAGFLQQYVIEKSSVERALTYGCAAGSIRGDVIVSSILRNAKLLQIQDIQVGLMSACDNAPSLASLEKRVGKPSL